MDFFQCLGSLGVSVSALLTTRDMGSLCSGEKGERREDRAGREVVEPGEMLDKSSESAKVRVSKVEAGGRPDKVIGHNQ